MSSPYLGNAGGEHWGDGAWSSVADLDREFATTTGLSEGDVLLAYYGYESYSGEAFVLFQRDGILYEVNGSHCSCHGLEDQWKPEAALTAALRQRTATSD
jgi:hypothetical protein